MVSLGGIGAIVGGLGSLAGGVSGFFKKKPKAPKVPSLGEQYAHHRNFVSWSYHNELPQRVRSAQRMGIHPLYALSGGNSVSAAPISVGGSGGVGPGPDVYGDLARAGQGVGRAISAYADYRARKKAEAHNLEMQALDKQKTQAEIDVLRSEAQRNLRSVGSPPAYGDPASTPSGTHLSSATPGHEFKGFGDPPQIKVEIPPQMATVPGKPNQESGVHPGTRWERTATGFKPQASAQIYQEQDITNPAYLEWYGKNRLAPIVPGASRDTPPDSYLPPGAQGWKYNPWRGEFEPSNDWTSSYFAPRKKQGRIRYKVKPRRKPYRPKSKPLWRN